MSAKKESRSPEKGELIVTEIYLSVLHPSEPYVGSDPFRTVMDAIKENPSTIVLRNGAMHSDLDIEVPERMRGMKK